MSQAYKTTGIVLKSMPLGEADRLIIILSPEKGLIRAIAPSSRKNKSPLSGRSELFMVNQFLIIKGHSLDKIAQAETLQFYPGLRKELVKLAAAQYLSELILKLSIDEQPQEELYELLNEHLRRLEKMSLAENLYGYLAQAIFHFLIVTGIGPQIYQCCLTQEKLTPNFKNPDWQVGFSHEMGGLINLKSLAYTNKALTVFSVPLINYKLQATDLVLLQNLNQSYLPHAGKLLPSNVLSQDFIVPWQKIEHLLRDYTQYQLGCSFQSVVLIDSLPNLEF